MTDLQLILTISIPSILVILSWINNNTRLSRLETAVDGNNKRIDDLQRSTHTDLINLYNEVGKLRERIAQVEVSGR